MMVDAEFGAPSEQVQALVRWREALGLSQLQVAVAIKVDAPKYSKWERGLARLNDLQVVAVVDYLYRRAEALSKAIPQAQQQLSEIKQQVSA